MADVRGGRSISVKIMLSYLRASLGSNVVAVVAIGFSMGVLAAVINVRSALLGTDVGDAITVNLALNVAISWTIASIFCVPQIVGRAFTKFDYFISCLQVVGWSARRYSLMLIGQLLMIVTFSIVLSYPIAAVFQRLVMMIHRRDSDDLLYPARFFEPIALSSILVAALIGSFSVIIVGVMVFLGYARRQKVQGSGVKPVRVTLIGTGCLRWGDSVAVLPIVLLIMAARAGAQAGLFVILGMVFALFWLCSRSILYIVRGFEKMTARWAGSYPAVAVLGAFSAELHAATKSIALPLAYVFGIPAIVLSVSHTEAYALNQTGGGIQNWDFLVMLGLPLFFVGTLSLTSFLMAADQVSITSDRLRKIGFPEARICLVRFAGVPLLFVGIGLVLAAIFAVFSSMVHVAILGSSANYAIEGLSLSVSLTLAAAIFCSFIVCGAGYLAWGAFRAKAVSRSLVQH
ncbi:MULTISPECIES: hypothetical protein [Corynebacterium]|uniref:FtsX-like permease family protein n=1 Tax=Corynebacterium freneyi TaxID=134034 RepID=A0ABS4U7W2_9CORY|nr:MULTISPECIES: hypothetical protein [Corynebacterium]MBP2332285.1 hypothetical protein [Corynebacterium freneyi]MCG7439122.1 hypothetical protein [Corynebacterium freneyi]QXA53504.1 hypothetical protein I6L56_03815 [Corynebacterium freneyi]UBI01491.1 hypothetical protein LA334_08140 [Corynebacterium freneyi]